MYPTYMCGPVWYNFAGAIFRPSEMVNVSPSGEIGEKFQV